MARLTRKSKPKEMMHRSSGCQDVGGRRSDTVLFTVYVLLAVGGGLRMLPTLDR